MLGSSSMIDHYMALVFEKLTTQTLRGQIANRIRSAIFNGSLRPGDRLVERKLASEFGASLTVVREALIELETEGFITKRPNAFTYVTKLSIVEIEKVFALRKVLETHAIQEAARLATADAVAELEVSYLQMVDSARRYDLRTYIHEDLLWHESIWRMAENEFLTAALRRIIVPLFTFTSIRFYGGSSFDLLADAMSHMPLLEAIKARDPATAGTAALSAMEGWLRGIRDYLKNDTGGERSIPLGQNTHAARQ
jgi:DNA-binding GntR family transcriptional regulator